MSDQTAKKKHKIKEFQSAGCSQMSNARAQRLLYEIQSTDSNQSTQTSQDVGDNIIKTYNDQNTSNLRNKVPNRVDKNAAERSRLYRERHREEINQRRRETRQRQRNLQKILHMDKHKQMAQEISNKKRNAHTRRQQRYYEKHREEINKRKRDNRLKQNITQSIVTANEIKHYYREQNNEVSKKSKKDSRQRQNMDRIHKEYTMNQIDNIELNTEVMLNDQQSLSSSNDDNRGEVQENFTSSPEQIFTQHLEETQNDKVHTTMVDVETIGDQNSNSYNSDYSKKRFYVKDYYIQRKEKPAQFTSGEVAKKRSDLLSFLDSSSQKSCVKSLVKDERVEDTNGTNINVRDISEETQQHYEEMELITREDNKNNDEDSYSLYHNDIENEKFDNCNIKLENISHCQKYPSLLKEIYQKRAAQNELDETDLFFCSMSKIVKKLPRYEQAQLRMQIGLLVGNAELRHHVNDSS